MSDQRWPYGVENDAVRARKKAQQEANAREATRLRAELRQRQEARAEEERVAAAEAAQEAGPGSIAHSRWLKSERERLERDEAELLRQERRLNALVAVREQAPAYGFRLKAAHVLNLIEDRLTFDGKEPVNVTDELTGLLLTEPDLTDPLGGHHA